MKRDKNRNETYYLRCVFKPVTIILAPLIQSYQVKFLIKQRFHEMYAEEIREILLETMGKEQEKKIQKHVEKYIESFTHLDAMFHRVYNERSNKRCKYRACIPRHHLRSLLKKALRIMYSTTEEELAKILKLGRIPEKVETSPDVEERITRFVNEQIEIIDLRSLRRDVITIEPIPFINIAPLLDTSEIFPRGSCKSYTFEFLDPMIHTGEFLLIFRGNEKEFKDLLAALSLSGRIGLYRRTRQGFGQYTIEVEILSEDKALSLIT